MINVKTIGAIGDGKVDDTMALQYAFTQACMQSTGVYLPRGKYRITSTINAMLENFKNFSLKIVGDGLFWDIEALTTIIYDAKQGAAININNAKGLEIEGVGFIGKYTVPKESIYTTPWAAYSDPTIVDAVNDPHCAIKIDGLSTGGVGGSTGIRISKCAFRHFNGGINISPSGTTYNAEMIKISDCRAKSMKYFTSGGQAQEKANVIEGCGIWGEVHTAHIWVKYGMGHPGHYIIRDNNYAQVGNLVSRASQLFSALTIRDCYAEMLGSIGYWNTSLPDAMENCHMQMIRPELSANIIALTGNGVTFKNTLFRHYDNSPTPMMFKGNKIKFENCWHPMTPIKGWRYYHTDAEYQKEIILQGGGTVKQVDIVDGTALLAEDFAVSDTVVFYAPTNYDYQGMGQVTQNIHGFTTVRHINLPSGPYRYGVYKPISI